MFNFLKKKKIEENIKEFNFKVEDVRIELNIEDSQKHINKDFAALEKAGIHNIIKNDFLPWLKGKQFKRKNEKMILDGIEIYDITYHYGRIIEKYSPTKKEGYFGQFEFSINSTTEYTQNIFESVAMQVYVFEDKIVKVSGYEI